MFLGPGIVLGVAALLAVVVAQLPEGSGAICLPSSDVDSDQDVDPADALFILQHVVGMLPVLCSRS